MPKHNTAARTASFQFEAPNLIPLGGTRFEIELPLAAELNLTALRELLREQFSTEHECERFIDKMYRELRRQQLSDAIADMLNIW